MAFIKGADADALDQVSDHFRDYGGQLDLILDQVRSATTGMQGNWGGRDYAHSQDRLLNECLPAVGAFSHQLRKLADKLHENAVAQRKASDSASSKTGSTTTSSTSKGYKREVSKDGNKKTTTESLGPLTTTTTTTTHYEDKTGRYQDKYTTSSSRTTWGGRTVGRSESANSSVTGYWTQAKADAAAAKEASGDKSLKERLDDKGVKTSVGMTIAKGKEDMLGDVGDKNHAAWSIGGMNKDGTGAELSFGKLKAENSYDVGIKDGKLQAGGAVALGAYAAYAEARHQGEHLGAGGKAYVGAEANAKGSVGIGKDGASVSLGVDAFAGGKAEGDVSLKAAGVTAKVGGEVSYGIGAHAKIDGSIGLDKVKLSVDVGATLGIGAGVKFDIDVNPQEALKAIGNEFGGNVEKTAEAAAKTLDDAGKAISGFFGWHK